MPRTAYLICATPRSGSTLLCELLRATGVAGLPEEPFQQLRATNQPRQPREYFDGVEDPEVLALLRETEPGRPESAECFEERLQRTIAEATTPNGVFATKVMWGYALDLLTRLRERPQTADLAPVDALRAGLGIEAYVHVTRPDKVAQAVSLWTAVQTERWRDEGDRGDDGPEPEYRYAGIAHLVDRLEAQDRAWRAWLKAAGVDALTVTYDELVADQEGTVRRVLEHVGVDPRTAKIEPVRMRRQSGGRSAEWVARFHDDRRAVTR